MPAAGLRVLASALPSVHSFFQALIGPAGSATFPVKDFQSGVPCRRTLHRTVLSKLLKRDVMLLFRVHGVVHLAKSRIRVAVEQAPDHGLWRHGVQGRATVLHLFLEHTENAVEKSLLGRLFRL